MLEMFWDLYDLYILII